MSEKILKVFQEDFIKYEYDIEKQSKEVNEKISRLENISYKELKKIGVVFENTLIDFNGWKNYLANLFDVKNKSIIKFTLLKYSSTYLLAETDDLVNAITLSTDDIEQNLIYLSKEQEFILIHEKLNDLDKGAYMIIFALPKDKADYLYENLSKKSERVLFIKNYLEDLRKKINENIIFLNEFIEKCDKAYYRWLYKQK